MTDLDIFDTSKDEGAEAVQEETPEQMMFTQLDAVIEQIVAMNQQTNQTITILTERLFLVEKAVSDIIDHIRKNNSESKTKEAPVETAKA